MSPHLILRLKGPFASFGQVAGEEVRRIGEFPTRSMVLGLIGNAVGLNRCEPSDMSKLNQLQESTRFAALALSTGAVWEDVQNARVPAQAPSLDDPEARVAAGGRVTDEPLLSSPKDGRREKLLKFLVKPVQRRKHYVTDAHFLVALSPTDGWPADPGLLAAWLRHPARPLWLGRKACPPAAPVCPLMPLVSADSGLDALRRSLGESIEQESLSHRRDERLPVLWEGNLHR
jgi:CRISPR system Cascade subunit CasD